MTTWASTEHSPIPGYEPIRVLGRNGAIVYLARSVRFDKPVVLQVWERYTLPTYEAAVVGLEHPHILRVLDVGEIGGHLYVALEYLDGVETLARLRQKLTQKIIHEASLRSLRHVRRTPNRSSASFPAKRLSLVE